MLQRFIVATAIIGLLGCHAASASPPHSLAIAAAPAMNTSGIEQALGMAGKLSDGVFRVNKPRTDLRIAMDGFPITPRMGLTAWMAFIPHGDKAMLMGDLPLLQDELQPVLTALMAGGVEVSGLHNHFVGEQDRVMFLHVGGMDDPVKLARGLRAAWDAIRRIRGPEQAGAAPAPDSDLDPKRLSGILGVPGDYEAGVFKVTVTRPEIDLTEMGVPINSTAGFNSWAAFQGKADRAAVSGDFAMLADEVNPVVTALRRSGIDVVAIHNHMIREQPRLFFLHFWGVGPADNLARGIRSALDQMRPAKR